MNQGERTPDVSELRQWSLLRQLHEGGGGKLGSFLKENGYPWDAAQKPFGKYYAQIRNKNVRIMALSVGERIEFIEEQICELASGDESLTDVKQLPTVSRMKLVDILAGLPLEGKRKIIAVLKDLSSEEQGQLIGILGGI
jgi:hypothetical protein